MSKIPVVFTFDKRIILGAAVTIKSLIDCANSDTEYDIYVYHPDLSEKTIKELDDIETEVSKDELAGRVDLTDKKIFTIDGADTKDIDDAISLEMKNGNYLIIETSGKGDLEVTLY